MVMDVVQGRGIVVYTVVYTVVNAEMCARGRRG